MAVRDFLLPDLGEGLEDAEVVAWHVAEGDAVELNQTLVEVNTAKALVEIPSPWAGVVERLHAADGDVVKVGLPLVSIRVSDADAADDDAADAPHAEPGGEPGKPKRQAVLVGYGVAEDEPTASAAPPPSAASGSGDGAAGRRGPVPASPPVRRLAKELGIDLAGISGTGPGGRVTREDVRRAQASAPAVALAAGPDQRIPLRGTRRLIAQKMTRSIGEIPHVTTFLSVDCTSLEAFRAELTRDSGQRIGPLPIVVRALAEVCSTHPKLNASFDADASEIVVHGACHVGIATDTDRGLLVPVVRDVASKGIAQISAEIAALVEAARGGTIRPEDLTGSTITVTNVGTFGAEFGTPIINHPEASILALGVIEPRALVVDGAVEARPATTLSLAFDHRLLDGAEAGRALKALGDLLASPFKLGALPR